jgi:hypothetical protein
MVVCGDQTEVAYLCAVHHFAEEVLINHHVQPTARVTKWNTFVSGVTVNSMTAAHRTGRIIHGWEEARQRLWRFMSADTILVGHAMHNDLNALGMWHPRILDTAIMTSKAVFLDHAPERTWSLKALAKQFLGYNIQGKREERSLLHIELLSTRVQCPARIDPSNQTAFQFSEDWLDS